MMTHFDPSELLALHGLSSGPSQVLQSDRSGDVLRIETDQGPVVLKMREDPELLSVELTTNRLLADSDIPVAKPLGHGPDPVAHVVFGWIDGSGLSSNSPLRAQWEAGAILRRIHALGGGPPYAGNDNWANWMQGWLNHALPWWRDTQSASKADVAAAWRGFERLRPLLTERGHEFILFDGRPEHFLVRGGSVVGLIDLENARGGDAGMDLGVMGVSDPALLTNLLAGYEPDAGEVALFGVLLPFYVFLRRLAAAEFSLGLGDEKEASRLLALVHDDPIPSG